MNTIDELVAEYRMPQETAMSMIRGYKEKVGTSSGILKITDITYIGEGGRRIDLECTNCGAKYQRVMVSGRNKWSELLKTCPCQKEIRAEERKRRLLKKREEHNYVLQKEIGHIYGDFKVIDVKAGAMDVLECACTICGVRKTIRYSTREKADLHCTKHFKVKYDGSYIGKKNNMLTVIGLVKDEKNHTKFLCKCDCGKEKMIQPSWWEIGCVKSCGCYQKYRTIYNDEEERIERIYNGMKQRCLNSRNKSYQDYGGRGITICKEWLEDKKNFIRWSFENGYDNTKTIDRIDYNGNYEPSNCRWATWETQNINRRKKEK